MSRSAALITPLSFSNSLCGSKDKSTLSPLSGALQSEAWAIISHIRRLQFTSHHTKKRWLQRQPEIPANFFIDMNDSTLAQFFLNNHLCWHIQNRMHPNKKGPTNPYHSVPGDAREQLSYKTRHSSESFATHVMIHNPRVLQGLR